MAAPRQRRFSGPARETRAMRLRSFLLRLGALLGLAAAAVTGVQPVMAQSLLRDAETEQWLAAISSPLIHAAGLEPNNVRVVLVQDPEINAFVAGGQVVYLNSGTIEAADSANEVQGVIAHELGHIAGGHAVLAAQNLRGPTAIAILSLLLGAAALAAGAGEAGMAAMMAGQQAAQGKALAFSRVQEATADAAGAKFLRGAGITGKGYLSFFGKLRQQEYRLMPTYMTVDSYMLDHPMSAERQEAIEGDLKSSPAWDKPPDPLLQQQFLRIKAKLTGYVDDADTTLNRYPDSDQSIPAHYARAYAWHKAAYPDKAEAEVDALLRAAPHDPYFLELKGEILLETGKPAQAVVPLREAVARSGDAPLIAATFGHALLATEDPKNYAEAQQVLKVSVQRDNDNPFAWYQLGIIYEQQGDEPRAALATAERYSLQGQPRLALGSAQMAVSNLPQGSTDWLRAQDIALASRAEIDQSRGKK